MVFDTTFHLTNNKSSYPKHSYAIPALPTRSKKRSKSKRRCIKRDTPYINERQSSLYLPKLEFQHDQAEDQYLTATQATVHLPIPIYSPKPSYPHTYTSNYNNILSLNSPTYLSTIDQHRSNSVDIDLDSKVEYTAGSELIRPFSTCSTYSNNSLGLDFFPSPPDHHHHNRHSNQEEEEAEDSISTYCHFDHQSDFDSRFPETETETEPETENTTYVSNTPLTSYDFDPSNIDIDIDTWKSRPRLVSFSTTNLHSHNHIHNSPYPCLFSPSDPSCLPTSHGIGTGTGNIHHQAYNQQQRHSFYDSHKNYNNWAKEKFYASEIDLSSFDTSLYPTPPLTPLQVIHTRPATPSPPKTPTNTRNKHQYQHQHRHRLIDSPITPTNKKKHQKKLSKSFSSIIDRMTVALETRKKDSIGSGLIIKDENNILTDQMTAPPPIPARSRLRSVASSAKLTATDTNISSPIPMEDLSAPSTGSSTMKVITYRQSSLYRLPVDPLPLDNTPTTPLPKSPSVPAQSPTSPTANEGTSLFGRRKNSRVLEKDPLKVRDGLQARESSSGVYTPQTFPGAQGPRPSHFPTHVYTPTNFALYPQPSPISPSGSSTHSSSSSQSDSTAPPKTPLSPTGRISKVVSLNMRRFSSGIVSLKEKTTITTHQRSVTTPMLENGEYLPNSNSYETNMSGSTNHSRESSWASWTPSYPNAFQPRSQPISVLQHSDSGYFPPLPNNGAGLGVGLDAIEMSGQSRGKINFDENGNNTVIIEASMDPINFAAVKKNEPSVLGQGSGSLAGKGKRKPVPRLNGAGVEEAPVHAM